jgi:hypothetical protein
MRKPIRKERLNDNGTNHNRIGMATNFDNDFVFCFKMEDEMKRYDFIREIDGSYIEECEHGEWVKWEDIKLMIETKPPNIEVAECQCINHVYPNEDDATYWICPVHGYKKR